MGADLDVSWQAGLAMAARQGLRFGHDVVFTYGPLGFLGTSPNLWSAQTAAATFCFAFATHVAFLRLCVHQLRRLRSPLLVIATTVLLAVVTRSVPTPELLTTTFLLVALSADSLRRPGREVPHFLLLPLATTVTAVQLLVKASEGIMCLGILVICCWSFAPRRRLLAPAIGLAATSAEARVDVGRPWSATG